MSERAQAQRTRRARARSSGWQSARSSGSGALQQHCGAPPSDRLVEGERRDINRLFLALGNSIPRRATRDVATHGAPRLRSIECVVRAMGSWGAQSVLTDMAGQMRVGGRSGGGWDAREPRVAASGPMGMRRRRDGGCCSAQCGGGTSAQLSGCGWWGRQARAATHRESWSLSSRRSCSRNGSLRLRRSAWRHGGRLIRGRARHGGSSQIWAQQPRA